MAKKQVNKYKEPKYKDEEIELANDKMMEQHMAILKLYRPYILRARQIRQSVEYINAMQYFRRLRDAGLVKQAPNVWNRYTLIRKYPMPDRLDMETFEFHMRYIEENREELLIGYDLMTSREFKAALHYFQVMKERNIIDVAPSKFNNYRLQRGKKWEEYEQRKKEKEARKKARERKIRNGVRRVREKRDTSV